jgi:hypothetical protein
MPWKRRQVLGVDLNRPESSRRALPLAPPHSATASCSKGRLIRCTVPGLTPNCLAMTRTPALPGVARASPIRFSSAGAKAEGSGFLLPLQNPAHISRLPIRVAHKPTISFSPGTGQPLYADVMAITRMSILFRFTERVHITVRQKQRVEQKAHGHGHIQGRALPPWPLGAARRAVRGGRRCRRSRIQSGRGASAQRRRSQEASAARPEAWKRKPTAEVVLRFVTRRAAGDPLIVFAFVTSAAPGAAHEGSRGSAFARAIAFSYSPNL